MEVGVRVEVENLFTGQIQHTSSAYLTFVAIEKNGKRVPIPPVIPETEQEKRRFVQAEERRAYRLAMREKALQKTD
jgi:acyl-CoA hydrolase